MGGSFRNGFSIGATIGTYNHTGEDVKTIERKLPPVYVYGKDLSYHKTFGYWLLGVGGGATSQVGLGGGFQVSGNFYMNKTTQRLSINDYAGKGYEYGFDLLGVSLN